MNHDGGSNVLFKDGHVRWTDMDSAGRHPNPEYPHMGPDVYAIDTHPRHPDDADLD